MSKRTTGAAATLPVDLGEAVDALYARRAARLEAEREVERMKEAEVALKQHVIALLREAKLRGAKGATATAAITIKRTYKFAEGVGWLQFWAFARKDKVGALVQKRIAVTAVDEYLKAGKQVPGIVPEDVIDLSLNRVGA